MVFGTILLLVGIDISPLAVGIETEEDDLLDIVYDDDELNEKTTIDQNDILNKEKNLLV